jgi:hypothetical protein
MAARREPEGSPLRHGLDGREARRLLQALILLELALVAVYAASELSGRPFWTIHQLFDLDGVDNLPAWFSASQLLVVGLVLALTPREAPGASPPAWFLGLLAAAFLFLSADEAASLHEKLTLSLAKFSGLPRFRGDVAAWALLYPAVALVGVAFTRRHLRALEARWPRGASLLAVGLGLFFLGAVVLEIASFLWLRGPSMRSLYRAAVAAEEFLELCGGSVMLYGALHLGPAPGEARPGPGT